MGAGARGTAGSQVFPWMARSDQRCLEEEKWEHQLKTAAPRQISPSGWTILEENIHLFSKIICVLLKNNVFSGRIYHFYLVLACLAENLPGLALPA